MEYRTVMREQMSDMARQREITLKDDCEVRKSGDQVELRLHMQMPSGVAERRQHAAARGLHAELAQRLHDAESEQREAASTINSIAEVTAQALRDIAHQGEG